jgi:hypothetical protein
MSVNSLNNTKFGAPGKKAYARSLEERRCDDPGCTTILSSYNTSSTCYLHTSAIPRHPLATR